MQQNQEFLRSPSRLHEVPPQRAQWSELHHESLKNLRRTIDLRLGERAQPKHRYWQIRQDQETSDAIEPAVPVERDNEESSDAVVGGWDREGVQVGEDSVGERVVVRSVQDVEVDGGEESLPVRADEGFGEES